MIGCCIWIFGKFIDSLLDVFLITLVVLVIFLGIEYCSDRIAELIFPHLFRIFLKMLLYWVIFAITWMSDNL